MKQFTTQLLKKGCKLRPTSWLVYYALEPEVHDGFLVPMEEIWEIVLSGATYLFFIPDDPIDSGCITATETKELFYLEELEHDEECPCLNR